MKNNQTEPNQNNEMPAASLIEGEIRREKKKRLFFRSVRATVYAMLVAAAAAVLVAVLLMPVFRIYGTSMTPTLTEGDIVLSVSVKEFRTGDLVGFYYGNKLLVKRCIAGPGDLVNIGEDGQVYVNTVPIDEPYISDENKAFGQCDIKLPYQVPEDRWFFMGDHRETSIDSRNMSIGCISEEQIKGKIVFRVWPLSKFGFVE